MSLQANVGEIERMICSRIQAALVEDNLISIEPIHASVQHDRSVVVDCLSHKQVRSLEGYNFKRETYYLVRTMTDIQTSIDCHRRCVRDGEGEGRIGVDRRLERCWSSGRWDIGDARGLPPGRIPKESGVQTIVGR